MPTTSWHFSPAVLPEFLLAVAALNRTLLASYLYYATSTLQYTPLFATLELAGAALAASLTLLRTRNDVASSFSIFTSALLQALAVLSSHAMFAMASPPVAIPVLILALLFTRIPLKNAGVHANSLLVLLVAFGVVGTVAVYAPVLSFPTSYIVLLLAFAAPSVLYHSTVSLASWRALALAATLTGVLAFLATSFRIPFPSPLLNAALVAINAALATLAVRSLSDGHQTLTAPFLISILVIALAWVGVPHDALAVHPILANFFLAVTVVPTLAVVWIAAKHAFRASPAAPNYSKVLDEQSISLTEFSLPKHVSSPDEPLSPEFTPAERPIDLHAPELKHKVATSSSTKLVMYLVPVALAVLSSIIAQILYVPTLPGTDPCSRTLFSRKQPLPSSDTHVLVTGGAGFIGSNLAEMLLDLGYKVRVLDNLVSGSFSNIAHLYNNPRFELRLGDVTVQKDVELAMTDIEFVYHLAAMSNVVPELQDQPELARKWMDTNAAGSFTVLDVSRNTKNVKKVIYAASPSTMQVNGTNARTPNTNSKFSGEVQMDMFDEIFNLPTVSIQFSIAYGPRQPSTGEYAITAGVFSNTLETNTNLTEKDDGSAFRDYIHVRDVCASMILAQQSHVHNMVIESGTGRGHSLVEVANSGASSTNQINLLGQNAANTCIAKIKLGFQAKHDFVTEMTSLADAATNPHRVSETPEFQVLARKLISAPWLLPRNSLVHLYMPHFNNLFSAAQAASDKPAYFRSETERVAKRLVLVPFTSVSRPLVENSIHTLVEYGRVRNILVVATHSDDIGECMSMNVACYNADGEPLVFVVGRLLDSGWTLHVTDPGTAYVRAVWPSVTALFEKTGAAVLVPDNANRGSTLRMYTATPAAAVLFYSLATAAKEGGSSVDAAYTKYTALCHSISTCKPVTDKVMVTPFSAPYPCLRIKFFEYPTPKSVCSAKWENVLYLDTACVTGPSSYLVNALSSIQSWFMAPNTCSKTIHLCQRVPMSIANESDLWSGTAACLGEKAQLRIPNHSPPADRIPVLVVGGAGYIGSHLVRALMAEPAGESAQGYHVTVLDNLSTAGVAALAGLMHKKDTFSFIYGSAMNATLVSKVLQSTQARVIVHAGMPRAEGCGDGCRNDIVSATKTLLESIPSAKIPEPPRLVFCSSSDVYGPTTYMKSAFASKQRAESAVLNPVTPWASGLVQSETMVLEQAPGLGISVVILRIFPVYGPPSVPSPHEASQLRWSSTGINLSPSMVVAHDWVHVKDVVEAIKLAIRNHALQPASIMNVGAGVLKVMRGPRDFTDIAKDADPVASGYVANLDNIVKVLGYAPKLSVQPLAPEPETHAHPEYNSTVEALKSAPWLLPLGLLRTRMIELSNDLKAIAAYASQNTKQLSIVPYQKKYRLFAENVLHSIIQYGQTPNVMMFAMDNETADECLWWNFPCFNASSFSVADFNHKNKYSDQVWAAISWVKPRLVSKLMDLGYSVHLTDTDIGYVRNVWSSYLSFMDEVGADISIAYEFDQFVANTGNYIVRPTAQAKQFFDMYNAIGDMDPTIADQQAFANLFRLQGMKYCQTKAECDLAHVNGQMSIRDYSAFFNRMWLCPHNVDICKPDFIYIHPICIVATDVKLETMKHFNGWYMSESPVDYYCTLKSVTGAEICHGVPAALLQGVSISEYRDIHWCAGTVAKLTAAVDN